VSKALDAVVVWVAAVLAITALNGLTGVAPGVAATAAFFGSSVGSFVGAALAEYRRVTSVQPEDVIDDLKDGLASITAAKDATAKPLFRDGAEDVVSRYKLNNTISNFVLRYHDGKKYSRQAMVDDGLCDQRYCNLGRRVLQEIGLMDWDSPLFKTKGSLQLDLEWAGRRWRTSLGQQVWALPTEDEKWH
jgi:hypothetical protein